MNSNFTTRNILAVILAVFTTASIHAQPINAYVFESSQGVYEPLVGGTSIPFEVDQVGNFNDIDLGFTFMYGDQPYTIFSVSTLGYIKLGGPIVADILAPLSDVFFGADTVLSIFGGNVQGNADSELKYSVLGVAPNRIFVLEYVGFTYNFAPSALNGQIRLYEATGKIDMVYGAIQVDSGFGGIFFCQVGIRGNLIAANTDFSLRLVEEGTSTWENSLPGTLDFGFCMMVPGTPGLKPASGLTYTWLPSAPCSGTPDAGTLTNLNPVQCEGLPVVLELNGGSVFSTGIEFDWQFSTDESNWNTTSNVVTSSLTIPFVESGFYRFRIACGASESISNTVLATELPSPEYATLPFLEDFDSPWEDRCGIANVPAFENWTSDPVVFWPLSWQGNDPEAFFVPSFAGNAAIFQGINSAGSSTADGFTADINVHFSASETDNVNVSFEYYNDQFGDSLLVQLSSDGGDNFTTVGTFKPTLGDEGLSIWDKKIVSLGTANSETAVLRFRAVSDGFFSAMAIDSLEIFTCAAPEVSITSSDSILCAGNVATLTATGGDNFLWSNGATSSNINVSPGETTTYSVTIIGADGCGSGASFTQAVDLCLSAGEHEKQLSGLYPNPTNDICSLKFGSNSFRTIALYDIKGQKLSTKTSLSEIENVDLSAFLSGIYLLRILNEDGSIETYKIAKQ